MEKKRKKKNKNKLPKMTINNFSISSAITNYFNHTAALR